VRGAPRAKPKALDAILGPGGSALWLARARGRRIACNPAHDDYPSLLAEALDTLAHADWDPAIAARRLDVSTSQLVGLIRNHPPALLMLNEARKARGMHVLH
jgi:hypothetical protein